MAINNYLLEGNDGNALFIMSTGNVHAVGHVIPRVAIHFPDFGIILNVIQIQ